MPGLFHRISQRILAPGTVPRSTGALVMPMADAAADVEAVKSQVATSHRSKANADPDKPAKMSQSTRVLHYASPEGREEQPPRLVEPASKRPGQGEISYETAEPPPLKQATSAEGKQSPIVPSEIRTERVESRVERSALETRVIPAPEPTQLRADVLPRAQSAPFAAEQAPLENPATAPVHVAIDRIEVVLPAAERRPVARAPKARASNRVSLADYLSRGRSR